jgi:hypothetical protein
MYLLQINQSDILLYIVIGAVIYLIITYYLIKIAIENATRGILKQLLIQNNLLVEALKKQGLDKEKVNDLVSYAEGGGIKNI